MIGAHAMTQDQSLPLGTTIAGHTVEQVLGQGGFGITYRVRNNANGGQAALKEFFPSDDADRLGGTSVQAKPQREDRFDMGRRAFLNEARTLNSLPRQRGLVRIQGAFEKHGTVYALMDFIDGEPLDRAMRIVLSKRPAVPFPLLKDLVESMIGALHAIHTVDVLHRDIKPGNVMIRRDGQPILIDFGAARPMVRANSLASMFSRRYAALEQAAQPLQTAGYQLVAAHLDENALDYRDIDYCRPTAILLGAERRGVSAAAEQLVDACITIPMVGMVSSLNVSVAAGIILAEAQRQRQLAGMYDRCRIDEKTYERLFFEWGHPAVTLFCQERGLRYPPLNEEGEINQPSHWYARVRAGLAPVQEHECE